MQPAEEISTSLLNARIGLLHYPAAYVTKSGVMAAYMAHGVVPVLVQPDPFGGKLKAGTHFAVRDTSIKRGAEIAQTAAMWYDENVHSRQTAEKILTLTRHAINGYSRPIHSSRR
ncbi:hypothetical protein [Salinibacter ruber]|uniref:hypothetical protein n=1 Tax=Salinibacter ruber TaxID=146919 RepID=UPI00216A19C8|nr:hypothetical protein [Salinibacter ruber]